MKKSRFLLLIGLLSALFSLSLGCAAQAKAPAAAATEADSSLIWQISVVESEITANISSTKAFVEYVRSAAGETIIRDNGGAPLQ